MARLLCLLVILAVSSPGFLVSGSTPATADQMREFFKSKLDASVYDKRIRPNQHVAPVQVTLSAFINSIHSYCPYDNTLSLTHYLRQEWKDARLAHSYGTITLQGQEIESLIWLPDTFVSTAIETKATRDELRGSSFVRINSDGTVLLSRHLTVKIACSSKGHLFPVDPLTCDMDLESCEFQFL